MEFSKEIMVSVDLLRKFYDCGKNLIKINYPVIEIIKYDRVKEITITLLYDSMDDTFELQEPVYQFYSKISFYDFKRPESRWTRDKGLLFSIIRNLKRSGFWEKISNKDFLIVNTLNKKTSVKERLRILKEVQNKFPR
jgi:hypothetical protein